MVAWLGHKWSLVLSMFTYVLFTVANFYPVWGTMIPASILLGLGAGPLWTAVNSYLSQVAIWYAKITGISEDASINRLFGIFTFIFASGKCTSANISLGRRETYLEDDLCVVIQFEILNTIFLKNCKIWICIF
jgi:hypothetical protein